MKWGYQGYKLLFISSDCCDASGLVYEIRFHLNFYADYYYSFLGRRFQIYNEFMIINQMLVTVLEWIIPLWLLERNK